MNANPLRMSHVKVSIAYFMLLYLGVTLYLWYADAVVCAQDKFTIPLEHDLAAVQSIVNEAAKSIAATPRSDSADSIMSLLELAASESDPTKKYAVLQYALRSSVDESHPEAAFKVIEAMHESFMVAPHELQVEALKQILPKQKQALEKTATLGMLASSVRKAIALGDYQRAKDACNFALRSVPRESKNEVAPFFTKLRKKAEAIDLLSQQYDNAIRTLSNAPNDNDANAMVGAYEFLVQNKRDQGLAHLTISGNKELVEIALLETSKTPSNPEIKRLADLWWGAAEKLPKGLRQNALDRAISWYKKCSPSLTGIDEAAVLKKIEETEREKLSPFAHYNLLQGPVKRAIVSGTMNEATGILTLHPSVTSCCQFLLTPPDEYDLECTFSRTSGDYGVYWNFPIQGKTFTWSQGGHRGGNGGFNIVSLRTEESGFANLTPLAISEGDRHSLVICVRSQRFQCFFDGKLVSEVRDPLDPAANRIGEAPSTSWSQPYLGIGDWWGTLTVTSFVMTEYR